MKHQHIIAIRRDYIYSLEAEQKDRDILVAVMQQLGGDIQMVDELKDVYKRQSTQCVAKFNCKISLAKTDSTSSTVGFVVSEWRTCWDGCRQPKATQSVVVVVMGTISSSTPVREGIV